MKIISDFHDYYDPVAKTGVDFQTTYHRNTEVIKSKFRSFDDYRTTRPEILYYQFKLVGFCGKVTPYITIETYPAAPPAGVRVSNCWNLEETDAFLKKHLKNRDFQTYLGKTKNYYYRQTRASFKRFFENPLGDGTDVSNSAFAKELFLKAPIWVISGSTVTLNCPLPDGFIRIKPPYQAFQDLYMWVCNQAEPVKTIPPISNKDMLEIKGFNKYSFKTPPSKE